MKFGVFCANDTNANKITLNFFFANTSLMFRFVIVLNAFLILGLK